MNKILVVEDQRDFQLIVDKILSDGQHRLTFAGTAEEAKRKLAEDRFDLILLDLSLPDQNGLELYGEIRKDADLSQTPLIFLTGSESVAAKVTAFSLGAEDYIVKNGEPAELKARVQAKIRKGKSRLENASEPVLGPFKFDLPSQRMFLVDGGREISLTPKQFKFLYLLAKNPDVVMNRDRILSHVWGEETNVVDRSVDTYVYQIRKKLGPAGEWIQSVSGVGYRFKAPTRKASAA